MLRRGTLDDVAGVGPRPPAWSSSGLEDGAGADASADSRSNGITAPVAATDGVAVVAAVLLLC